MMPIMHREKKQHEVRVKNVIDAEKPVNPKVTLQETEKNVVSEEEITGKTATLLHSLLTNSPKNPARETMIKAAITRFPHPGKPASLDIDL
jgi:hypothetical protein